MSSSKRLIDLSLGQFSSALASKESTPAGGSAAAAVGAQGVALGAKLLWLSATAHGGEQRGYLEASAEELEDLADCLLELVDRDAQAYRALVRGQAQGQDDDQGLERAQAALDAPAEIAELALIAWRRLCLSREKIKSHLQVDLEVALGCLRTSAEGGLAVAEVNLPGLLDAERRAVSASALADLRSILASLLEPSNPK